MRDSRLTAELAAVDEAIRAYTAKWQELKGESAGDDFTPQGWIISVEFTNFEFIDDDSWGHLLIAPPEQMASTSRGLAEIARDKYGR